MLCTQCGTENGADRNFCRECGSRFALSCPSCGAPNAPEDKFCGQCGSSLDQSAATPLATPVPVSAAPTAERRLVSVLFADLVGFTSLSERRDPEEVRELLTRYFDIARELITRYGGEVEKFIGDAVMAAWGTPMAHEDDAERAVRAALELTDAIPALGREIGAEDLRVRAGVLTGEAAVSLGARGQGMVAGDLVNTAARLQSAATPGTVLVGEGTYLATRDAIAFEDAGRHTLKGKELPARAWRATRVVAGHGGFRRHEGLEPPFVGRSEELRLVKDLFHATGREKRPRLCSIMGIGGIGKSRVAWEFFKYIDGFVETVYWHQGRCPSYGEGVTFWALGEMVRMRARIVEGEDAASSKEKLNAVLDDFVPDADERRWMAPRLAHLLGLGEAAGEREELFAAWRTFFERISDRGPTVLVFEDLQWADTGLVDFIEHTLQWARDHPIYILTLARPELTERRPTWGAGQRNFTSLYLEPLPNDAMRALLAGLAEGLPEDATTRILARAEGIPLYAVETVRMLIDRSLLTRTGGTYRLAGPLPALEVPDTLHALIASRLDALDKEDRTLLQDASVIGKTFTLDALGAVSSQDPEDISPRLESLVTRELLVVEADPRSPERGQYGFVQSLIREVAYQTLARRDRVARHVFAARYFQSFDDEEVASVVAAHYLAAHRAAPEAEADLAVKAREALLTAAERAASLGASGQALRHLEEALSVTEREEDKVVLWERAGEAAINAAAYRNAEAFLQKAREWHERHGDHSALARVTASLGRALVFADDIDRAIVMLTSALERFDEADEDPAAVEIMDALTTAYMYQEDAAETVRWADRTLDSAERLNLVPAIVSSLICRGLGVHDEGHPREGIALLRGALSLARSADVPPLYELRALINLSDVTGPEDPSAARIAAGECVELARKFGFRQPEAVGVANYLLSALSTGHWEEASRFAAETFDDDPGGFDRVALETGLAILLALRGDGSAAEERLRSVEALVDMAETPQTKALFDLYEAWLHLAGNKPVATYEAAGRVSGATQQAMLTRTVGLRALLWMRDEQALSDELDNLAKLSPHATWLHCVRRSLQAGLLALQGQAEDATTGYVQAAEALRALGVPFDLALSQLDFVTFVGPHSADARKAADEAHAIFTELGAKPFLARLEVALNSALPENQTPAI